MLGLEGAFPISTDEGLFYLPGQNYDQLMDRIYSTWTVPDQATVPQTFPQTKSFSSFVDTHQEKP